MASALPPRALAGQVLTRADPDEVLAAVEAGSFLVTPHADVREFQRRKVDDHDRWIRGMQRYSKTLG